MEKSVERLGEAMWFVKVDPEFLKIFIWVVLGLRAYLWSNTSDRHQATLCSIVSIKIHLKVLGHIERISVSASVSRINHRVQSNYGKIPGNQDGLETRSRYYCATVFNGFLRHQHALLKLV